MSPWDNRNAEDQLQILIDGGFMETGSKHIYD